jgi:hypothetical protein
MSSFKNQHYVPRCLLKPFTLNGEGKTINLYNVRGDRFIENAPVKNQCSRNFFYGSDLGPEKALSELEGEYARVIGIVRSGLEISDTDADWLRVFAILQTRRTAQAIARLRQFMDQMADETFKNNPDQRPEDPTHDELVFTSIRHDLNYAREIDDLKFIILLNKTDLEFSISDHPSVFSNRFSFENQKQRLRGFGLASSGLFLVLPVAPRLAAFFFDIGVYTVSIPQGTRFVSVTDDSDVRALNELQQLNAEQNIYFSTWSHRERFVARDERVARQRELKPSMQTLVRDEAMPDGAFRRGSAQEEAASRQRVIHAKSKHPRPRFWPGFLKKRKKPITFSNGSAAGLVRKAEWLRPGAFEGPLNAAVNEMLGGDPARNTTATRRV